MDKRLIPEFIDRMYKQKIHSGKFQAFAVSLDIKGFTPLTEALMKKGPAGAEEVSDVLNFIYEFAVSAIYRNSGWIIGFAGDAFQSIFLSEHSSGCIKACNEILDFIEKSGRIKTPYGKFDIKIRIGVSYGEVDWKIISGEHQWLFYFKGSALDNASERQQNAKPQSVVFPDEIKKIGVDSRSSAEIYEAPISEKVLKKFVPDQVLAMKTQGEFREIITIFLPFEHIHREKEGFLREAASDALKYGGLLNNIEFGDKSGMALVIFGVPVMHEKNTNRALDYILELKEKYPAIRAGISKGISFAGFIGGRNRLQYTSIGNIPNLAARLSMRAEIGQVLTDKTIFTEGKEHYTFEEKGKLKLKGISRDSDTYMLKGKHKVLVKQFEGEFVGRKKELSFLRNRLKDIDKDGLRGIVYISGAAGIGKSRLVDCVTKEFSGKCTIMNFKCDGILRESLNPIVNFLKTYFDHNEQLSNVVNRKRFEEILDHLSENIHDEKILEKLNWAKPYLGSFLNYYWKNSIILKLDPKDRFRNSLESIKILMLAESTMKPVIMLLEDVQWIDSDSVKCFTLIIKGIKASPSMVLMTGRDNHIELINNLETDSNIFLINLNNLGISSLKRFIESLTRCRISQQIKELIFKLSQGNPFYAEQLFQYMEAKKLIFKVSNELKLKTEDIKVPGKINEIIIARIDMLEDKLKELIKIASVIGHEFPINILIHVLKKREISEFLKKGLDQSIWSPLTELLYIFKHVLLKDAVYEMQLKKTLTTLHGCIAAAIKELYKTDLLPHYAELAYHYEHAGAKYRAREYYLLAANSAQKDYRNDDALKYYKKVVSLYKQNAKKGIVAKVSIGEVYRLTGKYEEAVKVFAEVKRAATKYGYDKYIIDANNRQGWIYYVKGDHKQAMKCLNSALAMAKKGNFKGRIVVALGHLGTLCLYKGDMDKAEKYYKLQFDLAKERKNKKQMAHAMGNLGTLARHRGNFETSADYLRKSLKLLEKLQDMRGISLVLTKLGIVEFCHGRLESAFNYYLKHLELAKKTGDLQGMAISLGNLGIVYGEKGDLKTALTYFEKKLKIAEEMDNKNAMSNTLNNSGLVQFRLGLYEEAEKSLTKSLSITEATGNMLSRSSCLGTLGELKHNTGRTKEAIEHYTESIEINKKRGRKYDLADDINNLINIYIDNAQYDEARELNNESDILFKEIGKKGLTLNHELHTMILNKKDSERRTENRMKNLLAEYLDDPEQGKILYELYRLTKKPIYREKAIKIYGELANTNQDYQYKRMLNFLKK
ncbi:tetratricopeptide repeat protein [bacterium]|nr:tetratricopeptide repeat protein [bacterium]